MVVEAVVAGIDGSLSVAAAVGHSLSQYMGGLAAAAVVATVTVVAASPREKTSR